MLKYLLIIILLCHCAVAFVPQCKDFYKLSQQQLWTAVKPNLFQIYFTISFGTLSVICLLITIATWKIYPSFSVPSDIMFAICCGQLLENTSLVATSIYFLIHNQVQIPPNFLGSCTGISVIFAIGNTSSILYNLVFCTILTLSIRKPLKGTIFNQFRYHFIVILTVILITVGLSISQGLGTGLSGICGYKLQNQQSFGRFSVQILIVAICIFSMYLFQAKIPKSSYFKRASHFGFYYYYMGIFSAIQILSTLGFLTGNIACRLGSSVTSKIIQVSMTFGSCSSILLSFVLAALRFSHPLVKMKIKKIFSLKKKLIQISEDQESQQLWLGSLIQSIKGSQIISFLTGILISFGEHQYKIQNASSISKVSFKKNYIIRLNEGVTDEYILRRIRNRDSIMMKVKLQGLRALQFQVTVYAIQIFTQMMSQISDVNIFQSFNIAQNLAEIKQKAYSDGGKSGQFFFGTHDNQYLIKTVTEDEASLYIEKIEEFYKYFKQNPNSMIAKILGLYKFVRKDIIQEPTYIILMRNVSPYDRKNQQRVYDIKGSQFNRSTINQKKIQNPQKLRNHTLKDQDFKKLQRKITIQPERSKILKEQLKKDAEFLGRMQVMDYSILIIKRKGRMRQRDEQNQNQKFNQFPSYAALDQYYNIGIIDYLQSWTFRRKAERAFKTMITKKKVTVTSPEDYSQRLSHFIDQII